VRVVEIDRALQITSRNRHADPGVEILGQINFQVELQDQELAVGR
jgi:hypothetical protein